MKGHCKLQRQTLKQTSSCMCRRGALKNVPMRKAFVHKIFHIFSTILKNVEKKFIITLYSGIIPCSTRAVIGRRSLSFTASAKIKCIS